jgi:hypothetical protein
VSDAKPRTFNSYDEFFAFYLTQHSDRTNRILHACGTLLSLVFVGLMIAMHHAWWALAWPLIAYSFAWFGHFVIEGNQPATFGHPWWSFISDFRMLWLMVTGSLPKSSSSAPAPNAN